jgi:hypothetical protein
LRLLFTVVSSFEQQGIKTPDNQPTTTKKTRPSNSHINGQNVRHNHFQTLQSCLQGHVQLLLSNTKSAGMPLLSIILLYPYTNLQNDPSVLFELTSSCFPSLPNAPPTPCNPLVQSRFYSHFSPSPKDFNLILASQESSAPHLRHNSYVNKFGGNIPSTTKAMIAMSNPAACLGLQVAAA